MEIKILEKQKNALLKREKVTFELISPKTATPDIKKVRELLVAELKTQPELLVIKSLYQRFGKNESLGTCYIYDTKEALNETESEYVLVRNLLKEKKEKKKVPKAKKPEIKK